MASSRQLFALFAGAVGATISKWTARQRKTRFIEQIQASLPAQPTVSTSTYTYGSVGPASLSSISYSYTYTVTTPTTIWQAPTFPTASPLPACASSSCPSQDKTTCLDADGVEYGLLCNTLFSGDVITSAGKFRGKDKRSCKHIKHSMRHVFPPANPISHQTRARSKVALSSAILTAVLIAKESPSKMAIVRRTV